MVTVKSNFFNIESWLKKQAQSFSKEDVNKFTKAIQLAEPYYSSHKFYPTDVDLLVHALECAATIAELNLYSDAVIATLLFALPKYSSSWEKEVEVFGDKVFELVDGIRKVSRIRRLGALADVDNEDAKRSQVEVMRKMLLAMASDIRVIIIILVGRGQMMLHLSSCENLEMLNKIANETVEIFSPLANRLGVWQIKWQLEDLSFKFLHPQEYYRIAKLLEETREARLLYIERIKEYLSHQMEQGGIVDYQVSGRAKHIYSIWKKMSKKEYDFSDLYDIRAVRVVVPEVKDCYTVLGIVHTKYAPIPGEFDDYISNPKANNYQSLHTCVIGPENKIIEIQIRTFAMHDHAEYGIAAHWRYKEMNDKGSHYNAAFAEKLAWVRQVLDWREELTERKDIIDIFKNEIFNDTIYVMTPNGRVISLPQGSTPIDFAYHVHSDLGHKCRGAKVDGHIVPLSTQLFNGQTVDIMTVKDGGPSINWLHDGYVKSPKAINHIRRYIRNQNQEEFLLNGREIFEREISRFHSSVRPAISDIVAKMSYENDKQIYVDLGRGDLSPNLVRDTIQKLVDKVTAVASGEELTSNTFELAPDYVEKNEGKRLSGILVDGISGIMTHIAKCCKPIPGDMIMGFVTQGKGVAIHRASCPEIKRQAKVSPHKMVSVDWGNNAKREMFNADIEVIANDRSGLLRDLTDLFAMEKISISGLRTVCKHNKAFMIFTLQINGGDFNFALLINKVFTIHGVIEVARK